MTTKEEIIEKLAELEHEQWMKWSQSLCQKVLTHDVYSTGREMFLKHQSWLNCWKSYDELTEEQKEQDRIWARKVFGVKAKAIFEELKEEIDEILETYNQENTALGEELKESLRIKEKKWTG